MGMVALDLHRRETNPTWKLQLLLFDVMMLGSRDFRKEPVSSMERYAFLRKLDSLDDSQHAKKLRLLDKNLSCIIVHWAGPLSSLVSYDVEKGGPEHHIIDSYLKMGSLSPRCINFIELEE